MMKIVAGMVLLGGMLLAADAPKVEPAKVEAVKPTISEADKLAIRELQITAERAQRAAIEAQRQSTEAYAALQAKAQAVAPAGYQLTEDGGKLALTPTPKPEDKKK